MPHIADNNRATNSTLLDPEGIYGGRIIRGSRVLVCLSLRTKGWTNLSSLMFSIISIFSNRTRIMIAFIIQICTRLLLVILGKSVWHLFWPIGSFLTIIWSTVNSIRVVQLLSSILHFTKIENHWYSRFPGLVKWSTPISDLHKPPYRKPIAQQPFNN